MPLRPGDVIRVLDRQTNPSKFKRLICIAPEKQLFLRINSEPKFRPHHPILEIESDFLEHDSYVELRQLIRPYAYDIQQAEPLGRLSPEQAASLVEAANQSKALSQDHKDLVAARLIGN
jgi:hypothetical protein